MKKLPVPSFLTYWIAGLVLVMAADCTQQQAKTISQQIQSDAQLLCGAAENVDPLTPVEVAICGAAQVDNDINNILQNILQPRLAKLKAKAAPPVSSAK